jgi:hypothetical protein
LKFIREKDIFEYLDEEKFEQGTKEYYPQYSKLIGRALIYCSVHARYNLDFSEIDKNSQKVPYKSKSLINPKPKNPKHKAKSPNTDSSDKITINPIID